MSFTPEYKREFMRNAEYLNRFYDSIFKIHKLADFRNKNGLVNRLVDIAFLPLIISEYAFLATFALEAVPESSVRTAYKCIQRS